MNSIFGKNNPIWYSSTYLKSRSDRAPLRDTEEPNSSCFQNTFFDFSELIPFGWGQNEADQPVHNKSGNTFIVETDQAVLKDDDVYAGHPNAVPMELDESNPHLAMAAAMKQDEVETISKGKN